MTGTIVKGIGGFYYIKASDGNIYECKARGVFRKNGITPIVGDSVDISISGGSGSIDKILPRKTVLIRPPVANIDSLVLVIASSAPAPNFEIADKMLVNAEINNIRPIICINKTDLSNGNVIADIYLKAGYDVVCTSTVENQGMEKLLELIKGHITAFAGLSGVGKSSILNLITDKFLQTGQISEKIQRGRHTTRHVELFELECGDFVLDTPGFSSLEITGIKAEEIEKYFPEFSRYTGNCRFRGCSHINEPECSVKTAVDHNIIPSSRYESYKQIYAHLKTIKDWER